jgi:tRNA 2-thiouridine synthesizing protein A
MVTGMTFNMTEVDARRLLFPIPVVRLQGSFNKLTAGARILTNCTDPGMMVNIPIGCQINNYTMIFSNEFDYEVTFGVEKPANES